MITRRTFIAFTAGGLVTPKLAFALRNSSKVAFYANNGSDMMHYDADVAHAVLTKRSSISLPAAVQYAWPHVSRRCLYVASSDGSKRHYVTALRIDPQTGELSNLGESVVLPGRPINISTDIPSDYALIAFNAPSGVRVFRINKDLTIGDELPQPGVTDNGVFAHQIRVTPDNRHAILVTRGVNATTTKPEAPGALKIFDYNHGVLSNETSIAPNGGIGFGPRHLDFHPTKPWVYVSLERESKLFMYLLENGRITADNVYSKDTASDAKNVGPRQLAGAIHMHPNGRFLYVSNRSDATVEYDGKNVTIGENSIVVYSIDQTTGEPTPIQHVDTRKVNPRSFCIDSSARLMTVQHVLPANIRVGNDVRVDPAGITVFRMGNDGRLAYERGYDVDVKGSDQVFWGGMVRL